jgi:2-C-methyl-D-erythritol 4-phosphate cytidylyltransferase / 2-C-methyl-D-erythritol 2,4-cyclodiphosphate synthase
MTSGGSASTTRHGPYASAVIVAAGSGIRMRGIDKLDAVVLGWPVLRWSVEALAAAPEVGRVAVVTTPERAERLSGQGWLRALDARLVVGGARRQDSVAAGVRAVDPERAAVVLVHDAARPLVGPGTIARVAAAAREHGAAIPVVPVADSLKRVDAGAVTGPLSRAGVHGAQTPQAARRDLLLAAVDAHAGGADVFGDEAELLARHGVTVAAVPGDPANVKVTRPEDLDLVRRLAAGAHAPRSATGWDSHPFGPQDGLRLGGVEMPEAPRLHGHSDGDVVLHALCDGLLGAAGLGDLGRLFPSGDPRTRDADSRALLASVVDRVGQAGWRPSSADVTIVGARPRLGGARLERMRASIADGLGLAIEAVSVKASTGNLGGAEGAGRVVTASCLVSVVAR